MTEFNDQDIKDSFDPTLPEAPVSITVKGYYKGFSVLITKRNAKGIVEPEKIIEAVDNLITRGFKPSWNDDTNGKVLNEPKSTPTEVPATPIRKDFCDLHKVVMKVRTNTDGSVFYSHGRKNPDETYSWCNGKGWK